jgi:hypothetical protein|nr:MAG TPA: hypothetical protein [Caudoviricetes sp.]
MSNFLSQVKNFIAVRMLNHTTYFVIIYTLAIFCNGYFDTKFEINDILMGYAVISGKKLIGHGIDSAMNSQRGEMPKRPSTAVSATPSDPNGK